MADRPVQLADPQVFAAYQEWLAASGLSDSDLNAWKFIAQVAPHSDEEPPALTAEVTGSRSLATDRSSVADSPLETTDAVVAPQSQRESPPPSTATPAQADPHLRWSSPTTILTACLLGLVAVVILAFLTAERWEKVVSSEVGSKQLVPDGTWRVYQGEQTLCWPGQNYLDCIDEYISSWNFACAERSHDRASRELCDNLQASIREMQSENPDVDWMVVESDEDTWRKLEISENTVFRWVVEEPEKTREAVCYLGFLGECEWHSMLRAD